MALDRVDLADLVDLRSVIETAALARAAVAPDPAFLDEARAALDVMRRPGIAIADYQEADLRFHAALWGRLATSRCFHAALWGRLATSRCTW